MNHLWIAPLLLALVLSPPARADTGGVISLESPYPVARTIERLRADLERKGMRIFADIDHARGARGAGLELRPTRLLIFGNPKVGTPLMQCAQRVGLDLPQKALAWEDAQGQVWLSYNDPAYVARRHAVQGCETALKRVAKALAGFARRAITP